MQPITLSSSRNLNVFPITFRDVLDSFTMTEAPSFRFLLLLIGLSAALFFTPKAAAVPPPGYYLVWSDEFNSTSLDRAKWDYWLLGRRRNAINVTNAISLNGSNLVITTYTSNKIHYTGFIATDETFRPRYGYWESSIRWSDTNGMWSAFWLQSPEMTSRQRDPQLFGTEIDIAEHRFQDKDANNIANKIQVNLHWNGYGPGSHSSGSGNIASNLADGFHTYGFLWTPDSYSFLVDDSKVYGHGSAPISHSTAWVALSSEVADAISTPWAGQTPPEGYGSLADSTTAMTVDYVRYYAPSNVLFWTGNESVYWTNSANWVAGRLPSADSDLTISYLSAKTKIILGENVLKSSARTGSINHDASRDSVSLSSPKGGEGRGEEALRLHGEDYTIHSLVLLQSKQDASVEGPNTLNLGAGGIDMSAASRGLRINARVHIDTPQTWVVGQKAGALKIAGPLDGSETVTKAGPGTLILDNTNEFGGQLNIDAGILSIGDSIEDLTLPGGLILSSNSIIALKINNQLRIPGGIIYRGTLTVSNSNAELKAGDHFKLFEAGNYRGAFEHFTLPSLPSGLEWNTGELTNGNLSVIATTHQPQ